MSVAELEIASEANWLSELSDEQVRSGLTLWAGRIAAGEATFVDLVGELDAREAWGGVGIKSPAHWLGWQCSLTLSTAREHVRVASVALHPDHHARRSAALQQVGEPPRLLDVHVRPAEARPDHRVR